MKRIIYLFVVVVLSFAATAAHADVVTLKNGDRVTGTFVNEKDGKLALKSEVLGDLSISVDKIASFTAEKPVALLVKGGKPVEGQLELTTSGEWKLTSSGASQTIAVANVEMILLATEYEALEHHEAKPWKDWKGNSTLGYSLQRGDQDTSNLAITVAAVRERPAGPIFHTHWRTNFGLTTLLAHATQGATTITSNTLDTSVREDYVFSPLNFRLRHRCTRSHRRAGPLPPRNRWRRLRPHAHQSRPHQFCRPRWRHLRPRKVFHRHARSNRRSPHRRKTRHPTLQARALRSQFEFLPESFQHRPISL